MQIRHLAPRSSWDVTSLHRARAQLCLSQSDDSKPSCVLPPTGPPYRDVCPWQSARIAYVSLWRWPTFYSTHIFYKQYHTFIYKRAYVRNVVPWRQEIALVI